MTGRISDERFTELSADYEAEQKELKERAAAIRAELSKAQEATVNAEKFMNVVRKYTSFEELTPTLLREFVEKIVVHECSYERTAHADRTLIFITLRWQGRPARMTARPIRRNAQTPDRNGKIFYTSTTSLSHISKKPGHQAAHGRRRCRPHRPDPDPPAVRPALRLMSASRPHGRPRHTGPPGKEVIPVDL